MAFQRPMHPRSNGKQKKLSNEAMFSINGFEEFNVAAGVRVIFRDKSSNSAVFHLIIDRFGLSKCFEHPLIAKQRVFDLRLQVRVIWAHVPMAGRRAAGAQLARQLATVA